MKCRECPHWNLSNKAREFASWGDCYRVLVSLSPDLKSCTSDQGHTLCVPFDPNDVKRYKYDSRFRKLYASLRSSLPKGVRVQKQNGKFFFQTCEDYECKEGA